MQISLPEVKKKPDEENQLEKGSRSLREFLAKFNHDWMMLSAAGLAYSLMVAVVPFGIAILAILGFTLGNLNPGAQSQLIAHISNVFPSAISSKNVLEPAITRLNKSAGILALLAVVTAVFGGSRLFIAMERCFDIVYRTYPRKLIPQYTMALLMMLVFIILTPIMVLASSLPAIILSLISSSVLNQLPGVVQLAHNGLVLSAASILGSTLVAWMLFQAIYMAVPHQKISFKNSWRGSLVAAILLELFLALFPLYVTHFLGSYTGVAGFAVIFLLFFYYFALILLFGAQVNAYFAEHVAPLPDTLAVVLCNSANRPADADSAQSSESQAALSAASTPLYRQQTSPGAESSASASSIGTQSSVHAQVQAASEQASQEMKPKRRVTNLFGLLKKQDRHDVAVPAASKKTAQKGAIAEAVAGTALAFMVTVIHLRRKVSPRAH
jgi:YihY family inner membrane protein